MYFYLLFFFWQEKMRVLCGSMDILLEEKCFCMYINRIMKTNKDIRKYNTIPFRTLFQTAFTDSLPVLMGYLSMGIAFGVLLVTQVKEANFLWAFTMSTSTISGSMQFASLEMLKNAPSYSLLLVAVLAFLINIRYAMYGISFIRIFKAYPWYIRYYLTMTLTDETYAIECRTSFKGKTRRNYFLLVSALDHLYWITGTVAGTLLGKNLPFDTKGIDFAMTALFLVILTDLCRERRNILPGAIGFFSTLSVLVFFQIILPLHINKMLLPAMFLMLFLLLCFRKKEKEQKKKSLQDLPEEMRP